MPIQRSRAPLADRPARGQTALLIIDMISEWTFLDAELLAPAAVDIAQPISRLKGRCVAADVPVIYVDDNRGRWRSDFVGLCETARETGPGSIIDAYLRPDSGDYAVLKAKHSGFYETPLDLLLRHLRVRQVILCGVSTEHCIVATAFDALMRDYAVTVPGDCVASTTIGGHDRALAYLHASLQIGTGPSTRLTVPIA